MLNFYLFLLTNYCLFLSISTQHSGAYSSPQYAKLLYPRTPYKHYITTELTSKDLEKVSWSRHPEDNVDRSTNRSGFGSGVYEEVQDKTTTFFETAKNFLSGSGGQLMAQMVQEFLSRSNGAATPSSQVGFECVTQVLSLNLTNLVILVVLKALILTAGFFGAGTWKGHVPYARSLSDGEPTELMSQEELQLILGYLASSKNQDYGCLQLVSCRKPEQARMYASAAELLVKLTGVVMSDKNDFNNYADMIERMRLAAQIGGNETDSDLCRRQFKCRDQSIEVTRY